MEIGAYLCFSGLAWILGLALVPRLLQRLPAYAGSGCLLPTLSLGLYLFVPSRIGMLPTQVVKGVPSPVTWHTYLDRGGLVGAALVLLYTLGLFWPLIAAWAISRRLPR